MELKKKLKNIVKDSPICTVDGEQQCTHSTYIMYVQETQYFSYWGNSENAYLFSVNPNTPTTHEKGRNGSLVPT
jgi:hypothetical protein